MLPSSVATPGPNVLQFLKLRNNYVFVYALMMGGCDAPPHKYSKTRRRSARRSAPACLPACVAGDWLQGPYVYALYQYYGFDVKDIGRLFIAGFGSSMIFGTIVGSLADKQ